MARHRGPTKDVLAPAVPQHKIHQFLECCCATSSGPKRITGCNESKAIIEH